MADPDAASTPVVAESQRAKLAALGTAIAIGFRGDPVRMTIAVVIKIITSMAVGVIGLYTSRFIADLAAADLESARANALILALWGGPMMYLTIWALDLRFRLEVTSAGVIDRELIQLSSSLVSIEHHEREQYVTELELLRSNRAALGGAAGAVFENVGSLTGLITTVGILGSIDPLLWLLPLAGIPVVILTSKTQQRMQRTHEAMAPTLREARHLETLATTVVPAKELRVFGLAPLIREREGSLRLDAAEAFRRTALGNAALSGAGWAIFGAAYAAAVAFVVIGAVDGRFGIGDVVLVVTLAASVAGGVSHVVAMAGWLAELLVIVGRYRWLREEVDRNRSATVTDSSTVPVPIVVTEGLRLDGVSFTYPGTPVSVLTDVDLRLPAGATVAIVGDNGAGKSTLVKLLTRMYEPTEGVITLDGTPLDRFDPVDWRARTSAGFQDFAKFELAARGVVGVGDVARALDEAAVLGALDRAASSMIVDQLADGLDTKLGRSFEAAGTDLSGGQWQKLALGRAMMRDAPLLLVLDEPTSALDAETEHELFTRYAEAAKDVAAQTGGITVLVSHRFSTVRIADLIVVLDGQHLVEVGSHADLMAADGLYAELYNLQAKGYR